MENSSTYAEIVRSWARERETLHYVQPYTARKGRQKALLFERSVGDRAIAAIDPQSIAEALVELGTHGGRKGQGLSSATLRAAHLAATQAVDWAMRRGMADSNPFREVERPKACYRRSRFLTAEQSRELAARAAGEVATAMGVSEVRRASFGLAVCLAIATGIRRGEAFALTWADFDEATGRIGVNKAVKADGEMGLPKSGASIRSIAVGPRLAELLLKTRKWQESHVAGGVIPETSIICDEAGERASTNAFGHWWRTWADGAGFEGLRYHELRHSHATMLISSGVDVKTVQMRLGHSSAEITMSCYAHAIPLSDAPAAAALDERLFG